MIKYLLPLTKVNLLLILLASLKRCVLSAVLKETSESICFSSLESVFQSLGAAAINALSPRVARVLMTGGLKRNSSFDPRL